MPYPISLCQLNALLVADQDGVLCGPVSAGSPKQPEELTAGLGLRPRRHGGCPSVNADSWCDSEFVGAVDRLARSGQVGKQSGRMAVWRGEQDDHPVSPVLHVLRVAPPSQSSPSASVNVTCRLHRSSRPIAISEVHASISGERLICVASDTIRLGVKDCGRH